MSVTGEAEGASIFEQVGAVAWITMNRPERGNSLAPKDWLDLAKTIERVGEDPSVGVIVLTGAGDKAFCSGGYLADLAKFDHETARRMFRDSIKLFQAIRRTRQPVIAAVNGFAVGGGNEIVIACDLAIASDTAHLGQVGPRVGSSPVFGGTNLLAMSIGEKRAKEVVFLCKLFTAQQAFELGWVNKVVPHAELRAEVERWCEELLDKSPAYLELSKVSSNVWWDQLQPVYSHGEQVLLRLAGGPESLEGSSAFMEKRKPNFRQFRKPKDSG